MGSPSRQADPTLCDYLCGHTYHLHQDILSKYYCFSRSCKDPQTLRVKNVKQCHNCRHSS